MWFALLSVLLVIALYWQSFSRMVGMWSLSSYQHGWLVYPVALYCLWRKREVLADTPVQASWAGVLLAAVIVFVWLLARTVGVQVVEFASGTLLILAFFWAGAGTRAMSVAAFPLFLLLAAVPIGAAFVTQLVDITAGIASALLSLVGTPAFRNGSFLTLPGGTFEVAEVCSGLRFLLAGVFASLVFAYLTYHQLRKRVLFVTLAAATMVITNGVRAFIVMYVASATELRVFAGEDHVIFGMVLFAVVFAGLIYLGERYADPVEEDRYDSGRQPEHPGHHPISAVTTAAVLLIIAAGPVLAYVQSQKALPQPVTAGLPTLEDCLAPERWAYQWSPVFRHADYLQRASYDCGEYQAGVYVAGYMRERQGKELINSGNRVWPHAWRRNAVESTARFPTGRASQSVQQVFLGSPEKSMLIWYWYQIGDALLASPTGAKLLMAGHTLVFDPVESSVIVVQVEVPHNASAKELRRLLEPKALAMVTWYRDSLGQEH